LLDFSCFEVEFARADGGFAIRSFTAAISFFTCCNFSSAANISSSNCFMVGIAKSGFSSSCIARYCCCSCCRIKLASCISFGVARSLDNSLITAPELDFFPPSPVSPSEKRIGLAQYNFFGSLPLLLLGNSFDRTNCLSKKDSMACRNASTVVSVAWASDFRVYGLHEVNMA
jgi:hypothetical protein